MARATPSQLDILLRVADIRDLAGVGTSAVVTNWRARSPKFPEPRVGGSQPLFELQEVLQWLRFEGPRGRTFTDPDPGWLWPRKVEAFFQQAAVDDPRGTLVALVAARHFLAGGAEWRDVGVPEGQAAVALRVAARAAEAAAEARSSGRGLSLRDQLARRLRLPGAEAELLADVARTLDGLEGWTVEQQLEPVLALEASAQRHRPQRTQPALARLLVAMGRVRPRSTVLDPAVGEGDTLVAAAEALGDDTSVVLVGQDISADASFVALARLAMRSCTFEIAEPGDSVRDERSGRSKHSVVLLDPPVADRGSSSELYSLNRWIEFGRSQLLERGRLVTVVPLHELASVRAARRRPDRRLQSLVESIAAAASLDAVVLVPRGVRADIVGPVAVLAFTMAEAGATVSTATVPVFALDGRAEGAVTDLVTQFADTVARTLASSPWSAVPSLSLEHVVRREVPLERLWPTLDELVDTVDPSRATSSRSTSPLRSRRDERSDDRTPLEEWSSLSRNAERLAAFEPLMSRLPALDDDASPRLAQFAGYRDAVVEAIATDARPVEQPMAQLAALVGHAATLAHSLRDDRSTDPRDRARRARDLRQLLEQAVGLAEEAEVATRADRSR